RLRHLRWAVRQVDYLGWWAPACGASDLFSTVQAECGDEVLVELEPDTVAGVDVGAVNPGTLSGSCPRECAGESGVVPAESREDVAEAIDERAERTVDAAEFVQDAGVPGGVGMVVRDEPASVWFELPVGAGSQQHGV